MDDADFLVRFGERLVDLRTAAALSQQQMAARAGLARSFYARMEGGGHNASLGTLRKVAAAHGLTVAALVAPLER